MSYSAFGRVLRETGAGQSSLQSPALPRRCGSRALARRRSGKPRGRAPDAVLRAVCREVHGAGLGGG